MSYFYLILFRIRKIDFSYFYAKLVKVSVKANGLYKKSHCSLCGGAMAEQVFLNYFFKCRFTVKRLTIVFFDIFIPVVFYKQSPTYYHYRLSSLSNHYFIIDPALYSITVHKKLPHHSGLHS